MRTPYNYSKIFNKLIKKFPKRTEKGEKINRFVGWSIMLVCARCNEVVDKVYRCTNCGIDFCKDCGNPKSSLCTLCMSYEEEEEMCRRKNGSTPLYERLKKEARAHGFGCFLMNPTNFSKASLFKAATYTQLMTFWPREPFPLDLAPIKKTMLGSEWVSVEKPSSCVSFFIVWCGVVLCGEERVCMRKK